MQIDQAKAWNKAGMEIARGYADKLNDITNNCAYSKYFYLLLMFDGDNGTGAIALPMLRYSMDRLAKRRVSISSSSPLKQLLGDFLSYCTLMFNSEESLSDARQTLLENKLLPSATDVLGTKVGAAFVAGRYDEVIAQRMGVEWSDNLKPFQKLNWRIMAIGEWFGEQKENASNAVALIGVIVAAIFFLVTVIGTFVGQGLIWAIVAAVILGAIIYYIGFFALGLLVLLTQLIFTVLRYVFYNIWTLILAIILFILI